MSENTNEGAELPPEERYGRIQESFEKWGRENKKKLDGPLGLEIPDGQETPIKARYQFPSGGLRFWRTLPDDRGADVSEVWTIPDNPESPIKLTYSQTRYDKATGKKLSWRQGWYGGKRVDPMSGAELTQDFDALEKFEKLQYLLEKSVVSNAAPFSGPKESKPASPPPQPGNVTNMEQWRAARKK